MLKQYQTLLLNEGINKDRIISINLEELENEEFLDYRILYKHITGRLSDNEMTYIFLDEVQLVDDFQKAVDSLYVKDNVDIYISRGLMLIFFQENLLHCLPDDMWKFLCSLCPSGISIH